MLNDSHHRHFLSSGRESSSYLTSSRPLELWGDAPGLRLGCAEKERRGPLNLTLTTQNPNTFRREHHYVPFLPQGSALKIGTGFFSSALFTGQPWWLPGAMKPPHFLVPSYSLHRWQEAPGPLWQALGSAHDVASPCCQVPATRSAWRRQIRAERANWQAGLAT